LCGNGHQDPCAKEPEVEELKSILLVQPDFPIPKKRRIGHDFLPIGLLKIGTYLRHSKGYRVDLVIGNRPLEYVPDEVWISSLFTYWSKHVTESSDYYRKLFPHARQLIGGIYATLMPEKVRETTGAEVFQGVCSEADDWCRRNGLDYSLLDHQVDFQIVHGMRGCFRKCEFCGVWQLEPSEEFFDSFVDRIDRNHVVFYDNNFLRNPRIKEILTKLEAKRVNGRIVRCESQSGFDGRILTPEIAILLNRARFMNPRIAWDGSFSHHEQIRKQIGMLENAGYKSKDVYVFMIFNWDIGYDEMERKRQKCWEFGVQISDCRNRPLSILSDDFDSKKSQTTGEYYIHPNWTDAEVKYFRQSIRRHNICVRHSFPFYSKKLEQMKVTREESRRFRTLDRGEAERILKDTWYPEDIHPSPVPSFSASPKVHRTVQARL